MTMIRRTIQPVLERLAGQYPVVTLTGPRQSGKTTLVRAAFPNHDYVSLEDPDQREFAGTDPRGFLGQFAGNVVLDEAQRVPDLFSYIQTSVDRDDSGGRYILSGSQNFLLMRTVSQSLAGRAAILHLLPFSLCELQARSSVAPAQIGIRVPKPAAFGGRLAEVLFRGFYPRIHDKGLPPRRWLSDYYRTYVERDVRELLSVGDLEAFGRFIRLCGGRNGQLLNLSGLANDCGVTHTTARRWLSVLEASFLVLLLRPHHRNFNKRLVRSPKLYFLDTGLLCYLLGIRSPEALEAHASRGAVFESFVVSELSKHYAHRGEEPRLFFWRDHTGHEVDLLIDRGDAIVPVEIKSGQTMADDFLDGIRYYRQLGADQSSPAALVYGGDRSFRRSGVVVYSWADL
jgi:hypothetical protein